MTTQNDRGRGKKAAVIWRCTPASIWTPDTVLPSIPGAPRLVCYGCLSRPRKGALIVDLEHSARIAQLELGRHERLESLFPLVYDELRALARSWLRRARDVHTLQPTAVVHEAYLRLANHHSKQWEDCAHFKALAAKAMRQVLSDHSRRRQAAKRGGGKDRVTLADAQIPASPPIDVAVFDLEDALTRLGLLNERQSTIAELRFLGGLTVAETAKVLDVSERTVKLDWQMARAWLLREIDPLG